MRLFRYFFFDSICLNCEIVLSPCLLHIHKPNALLFSENERLNDLRKVKNKISSQEFTLVIRNNLCHILSFVLQERENAKFRKIFRLRPGGGLYQLVRPTLTCLPRASRKSGPSDNLLTADLKTASRNESTPSWRDQLHTPSRR